MQKVTISELSEPVRLFFSQVPKHDGVLVEDDNGRACFGIIPYNETSEAEQTAAITRLVDLQKRVGERLAAQGKNEDELDRILSANE